MLSWANRFNIFCLLDSCGYAAPGSPEMLLAVDSKRSINLDHKPWETLKQFFNARPSWLFGHIGYEAGTSIRTDGNRFNKGFFFEPGITILVFKDHLEIESDTDPAGIFSAICSTHPPDPFVCKSKIRSSLTKEEYISRVQKIKYHIQRGDCYELNFCQEFFAEGTLDPVATYLQLVDRSPNPYSALYKLNSQYCLCASPERFLKKEGQVLTSQPIKGTSPRFQDKLKDEESRKYLAGSPKERSENIMVVDLVRNDLGRVCIPGSIKVKELCGIYDFPQVFQMISTIEGRLREDMHFTDAISACFPMGSMTGAPKVRVMELIMEFEPSARGLFSGSIGYITPDGDFDLNVVIRSLFYDAGKHSTTFLAGGGITFKSDPEREYMESMLKASSIRRILEGN